MFRTASSHRSNRRLAVLGLVAASSGALLACASILGIDDLPPVVDSGEPGDSGEPDSRGPNLDAGDGDGRCDPGSSFGKPEEVRGLGDASSFGTGVGAWLTPDEKTIYFGIYNGTYDIYRATRSGIDSEFEGAQPVEGINTGDHHELVPDLSPDERTIFFARQKQGGGSPHSIVTATRDSAAIPFAAPAPVIISPARPDSSNSAPFVSADGETLWFASQLGTAESLLVATARTGDGSFVEVNGATRDINSVPGSEESPVLSDDKNTLYFAATWAHGGHHDIYMSQRDATDLAFPKGNILDKLSMNDAGNIVHEKPTWISPDNCRIYFTVEVWEGSRDLKRRTLYVAKRPKK